jgi:uncharacterized membrane protein
MNPTRALIGRTSLIKGFLVALAALVLVTWLANTPAGLLGKMDAIGYAVCHRIPARSFLINDRPIPLCARCSGMYLGALLGFIYQLRLGRPGGMPSLKIFFVLGLFGLFFFVDGVNSYLHFFPNAPALYEPNNVLRLVSGTGLGIGMAAVLYPTFNQSIWKDWNSTSGLRSWKQAAALVVLALILDALILVENPLLLYPLAILSAATVVLILMMVYTIVWVMLLKRENSFHDIKDIWPVLLAGFTTAMVQIALVDLARFWLTGTWNGFSLG